MGNQSDEKPVSGVVIDTLPNLTFTVELSDGKTTLAYVSGKMRLHRIKVLVGDKVELSLSPDGERGRITRRLNQ
ncbi:MAG: translation initiation factor IF-1 [bacterium]